MDLSKLEMSFGQFIRLAVKSDEGMFMRHRSAQMWMDPNHEGFNSFDETSLFKIVQGLSGDENSVSFESANRPGYYVRHSNSTC